MRKAAWARNCIVSKGSSHTKGSGCNAAGQGASQTPPTSMSAREKSRMTRSLDLRQNSTPLTANHTLVAAKSRIVNTRSNVLTTMLTMKYANERTNVAHQSILARMSQRPRKWALAALCRSMFTAACACACGCVCEAFIDILLVARFRPHARGAKIKQSAAIIMRDLHRPPEHFTICPLRKRYGKRYGCWLRIPGE